MGFGSSLSAQSDIVKRMIDKYPEAPSFYFYQSTLRALNVENAKEFNDIIKGIDKLSIVKIDKTSVQLQSSQLATLSQSVVKEGYFEMMSIAGPDMNFAWYSNTEDNPDNLIALMESKDQLLVLKLDGKVDLAKIYSLKGTDLGALSEMLTQQGIFK